jgi:spore coat polysaccharide biosynthesis protein SpsF
VAIIQARMGSTRLPGKVLLDLGGKSVLGHVISRIRAVANVNQVVVATTVQAADEAIVREARRHGALSYRGSEQDVLARYYEAAREQKAEAVVRITSDCPLIDSQLVEHMVARFLAEEVDYLSNAMKRTYPRGMDTEVFSMAGLEQAFREAKTPAEREHVTPYFYRHPELFRLADHLAAKDHSRYRLTLDTPEDWQLIQAVVTALGVDASLQQVVDYLDRHPAVAALNAGVEQKALGH